MPYFMETFDNYEFRKAIEMMMIDLGFQSIQVKLAYVQEDGTEYIKCYKYNELYCMITFLKNYTVNHELKDWALIEYASSMQEAAHFMFEDGDMVPLDVGLEKVLDELKKELISEIKR